MANSAMRIRLGQKARMLIKDFSHAQVIPLVAIFGSYTTNKADSSPQQLILL